MASSSCRMQSIDVHDVGVWLLAGWVLHVWAAAAAACTCSTCRTVTSLLPSSLRMLRTAAFLSGQEGRGLPLYSTSGGRLRTATTVQVVRLVAGQCVRSEKVCGLTRPSQTTCAQSRGPGLAGEVVGEHCHHRTHHAGWLGCRALRSGPKVCEFPGLLMQGQEAHMFLALYPPFCN